MVALTLLEIVLGIDNIIFISILANKAPKGKEKQARQYGLLLGMVVRIIMLLGINWIQKQEHPLFTIVDHPISGKDILLILGGLFLLYQSVHEIHLKMKEMMNHASLSLEYSREGRNPSGLFLLDIL